MRADATHVEQVRELLVHAAAIVESPRQRSIVERLHAEVMGLVEDEVANWDLFARDVLEEERGHET